MTKSCTATLDMTCPTPAASSFFSPPNLCFDEPPPSAKEMVDTLADLGAEAVDNAHSLAVGAWHGTIGALEQGERQFDDFGNLLAFVAAHAPRGVGASTRGARKQQDG